MNDSFASKYSDEEIEELLDWVKEHKKPNYGVFQPIVAGTNTLSNTTLTVQLTTKGNPVLLLCTGDLNNVQTNVQSWGQWNLYRNGTALKLITIQTPNGNSFNHGFAVGYLDVVPAGTYTYTLNYTNHNGSLTLNESGQLEIPQFIALEIV